MNNDIIITTAESKHTDGIKKLCLAGSDPRLATAQSVFLYEVTTDTVVYAYNPDTKVHPGTLAKILLSMIVLENCEMDENVTVTEGIQSYIPSGASNIQLKSNEVIKVGDLLHAVIMVNANDAAVALAHHVASRDEYTHGIPLRCG